ncbi:MAG: caspase family protein [Sphingomonadaceae bacterium]|nr:caspase family protein [Sphingomonadaceae bacterium]
MLRFCLIFAGLCLALGWGQSAQAKRVALVIANGEYQTASSLDNPPRDGELVAASLREAGFETVQIARDLPFDQFLARLRQFRDEARGAEAALIYYAGHGIEAKGRNWLVPTDAKLNSVDDLAYEAIDLDLAMDALDGAQLRIAVLDACRNNPFTVDWKGTTRAVTRGLAPIEVDDVLVIYAAAPGMVAYDGEGDNSPFATSLARRILQPGLPVQMLGGMVRDDVLTATEGEQRPFISASITGRAIYLVGTPSAGPAMIPTSDGPENKDADLMAWEAALKLDTVAGYRAYLNDQPQGAFTALAEQNVAQLLDPVRLGGKLRKGNPGLLGLSGLPGRYDVPAGEALAIDGVWTLSTNKKRIRIERGRAFAVDSWIHLVVTRVYSDQVVVKDMRRTGPGIFDGRDILLQGKSVMKLRKDGNLDVRVGTFPFPTKYTLIREGVDDPAAYAQERAGVK